MFCMGCLKRLPAFVVSEPSVLPADKVATRLAREGQPPLALPYRSAVPSGFPYWLPALILALCAGFLGWMAWKSAPAPWSPARPSTAVRAEPQSSISQPSLTVDLRADSVPPADRVRDDAAARGSSMPTSPQALMPSGSEEGLQLVANFYRALAVGDGRAAASAMTPAKRSVPAYREMRMTRFYGSLREPLTIESLRPVGTHRFEATYSYRATRSRCRATAIVETEVIRQQTFIRSIRAPC